MRWLRNWYNERRRNIDLQILWPACKEQAPDLDHARAAFAMHAFHDDAWRCLGEKEIYNRISELT